MAFWQNVTQREILERNRHHKHLFVIWSTLKTDGFWHVFGSIGFLQLEEEKFRVQLTVINYLILNEIISSTIVYDQDANRSRRFTLAELGASLYFIAICFIQCFLFVDIWIFTWICYRTSNEQKVVFQGVTTVTNQHLSSWIYLEGMLLQLDSM